MSDLPSKEELVEVVGRARADAQDRWYTAMVRESVIGVYFTPPVTRRRGKTIQPHAEKRAEFPYPAAEEACVAFRNKAIDTAILDAILPLVMRGPVAALAEAADIFEQMPDDVRWKVSPTSSAGISGLHGFGRRARSVRQWAEKIGLPPQGDST